MPLKALFLVQNCFMAIETFESMSDARKIAYKLYIVNKYPMTKNKLIYHARISKQMKWGAFSEPFHLLMVQA